MQQSSQFPHKQGQMVSKNDSGSKSKENTRSPVLSPKLPQSPSLNKHYIKNSRTSQTKEKALIKELVEQQQRRSSSPQKLSPTSKESQTQSMVHTKGIYYQVDSKLVLCAFRFYGYIQLFESRMIE